MHIAYKKSESERLHFKVNSVCNYVIITLYLDSSVVRRPFQVQQVVGSVLRLARHTKDIISSYKDGTRNLPPLCFTFDPFCNTLLVMNLLQMLTCMRFVTVFLINFRLMS